MQVRKKLFATALAAGMLGSVITAGGAAADRDDDRRRGPEVSCTSTGREGGRNDLKAVGLTGDGKLICFSTRRAERPTPIGAVTGLVTDTRLVGLDHRPANGTLIGLGNAGGVYTLDPATAKATLLSRLNVALSGASFGVDFNPTVDRLRIVSDTGQNLRANVDTGATLADMPLTGGTANGAAYTNNDTDLATATTLFDITLADQVAIQAPPNNGNLNPAGSLGVDAGPEVGFDIYSTVREGTTVDVVAFAVLTVGPSSGLYEINLFTGKASPAGTFPTSVVDLAIPLNQL